MTTLGTITITLAGADILDKVLTANSAPKLFCKVRLGTRTQFTSHAVREGKSFKWCQEFKFRRSNEIEIEIELYHKNFFIESDFLGEGKIMLIEVLQREGAEASCFLSWRDGEVGKVNLRVRWEPDEPGQPFFQVQTASSSPEASVNSQAVGSSSHQSFTQNNSFELRSSIQSRYNQEERLIRSSREPPLIQERNQANLENSLNKSSKDFNNDEEKCAICLESAKLVAFYKCGHIYCCAKCARRFLRSRCPVCRQTVLDFIKIFRV